MPESSKKSPRQRFREEHAQFLERLSAGLTDLEIMRQMAWNKLQLKRHQAEAFAAGHQRTKAAYQTVLLADMPEDIRRLFPDATPDALLKIETDVSGFIASLISQSKCAGEFSPAKGTLDVRWRAATSPTLA